jgi:hypothetical protein
MLLRGTNKVFLVPLLRMDSNPILSSDVKKYQKSINQDYCEEFRKMVANEFGKMMANEFEMSMIGELSYFLELKIKQLKNGTFVSQGKYIKDLLK